jgi:hypothetical protein
MVISPVWILDHVLEKVSYHILLGYYFWGPTTLLQGSIVKPANKVK